MKALSILQPWAWVILHAGKDVENRTWETHYRGRILVHAGKSKRAVGDEAVWKAIERGMGQKLDWVDLVTFPLQPRGCLVGTVELWACVDHEEGEAFSPSWAEGPWCWLLRDPQPFAEPIPYRGQLGLFDVPDGLVEAALARAGK